MKKFISLIVFTLILGAVVGCGEQKNDTGSKDVSLEAMLNDIKMQIAEDMKQNGVDGEVLVDGNLQSYISLNLLEDEDSFFGEKLQLNNDDLKNGYVLAAMMNVNSDEIIILEALDGSHVESLKQSLENEKKAQIQTWEQYLPNQYEKVKNNIIKVNGNYLLYVTYENPEKIVEIFDTHLK